MANKKEVIAEGSVELFVPRGRKGEDPNLFIAINGKNYLIPKGKTSVVPDFVADEYHRSVEAENHFYEVSDQLLDMNKE